MNNSNEYITYIVKSILANNEFGITKVENMQSIASRFFSKDEYSEIVDLIKRGDIHGIKSLQSNNSKEREYLDVIMFNDQAKNDYVVTVYDSDDLLQDLQVIEIFKFDRLTVE